VKARLDTDEVEISKWGSEGKEVCLRMHITMFATKLDLDEERYA